MTAPGRAASAARVREATAADVERITQIYAHYVLSTVATFEEVAPDVDDMRSRFERIAGLGLPWLVAEEDGAVQGYVYAGPFRDRSAYRYVVEDSIYVAPDRIRQGYPFGKSASQSRLTPSLLHILH